MSFLKGFFSADPKINFPEEMLDHDASKLDYVVIDCEMTGLNPKKDQLLSIAAVKISQGKILSNQNFYKFIFQREETLREETILIHRLNHQKVSEGRNQTTVLEEFSHFCHNSIPLGHFFNIDLSFLNPQLPSPFSYPHLDTRAIAQYLLKQNHPNTALQLEVLCDHFSIPHFEAHNALGDATSTACLFLKLLSELRKQQIISLHSLLLSTNT